MKATVYKITLKLFDFEENSQKDIVNAIENLKFYYPTVEEIKSKVIEDWGDDHPLNKSDTNKQTFKELFNE